MITAENPGCISPSLQRGRNVVIPKVHPTSTVNQVQPAKSSMQIRIWNSLSQHYIDLLFTILSFLLFIFVVWTIIYLSSPGESVNSEPGIITNIKNQNPKNGNCLKLSRMAQYEISQSYNKDKNLRTRKKRESSSKNVCRKEKEKCKILMDNFHNLSNISNKYLREIANFINGKKPTINDKNIRTKLDQIELCLMCRYPKFKSMIKESKKRASKSRVSEDLNNMKKLLDSSIKTTTEMTAEVSDENGDSYIKEDSGENEENYSLEKKEVTELHMEENDTKNLSMEPAVTLSNPNTDKNSQDSDDSRADEIHADIEEENYDLDSEDNEKMIQGEKESLRKSTPEKLDQPVSDRQQESSICVINEPLKKSMENEQGNQVNSQQPEVNNNPQKQQEGIKIQCIVGKSFEAVLFHKNEVLKAAVISNQALDISNNETSYFTKDEISPCAGNFTRCDINKCIPKKLVCDGVNDCKDKTDEEYCCKKKLSQKYVCDSIKDCPDGSDEENCICGKKSYNCDQGIRVPGKPTCINELKRCDGFEDCFNGNDEHNCAKLINYENGDMNFNYGNTEGYLFRNVKGKWYPVCAAITWQEIVCSPAVIGPSTGTITVKKVNSKQLNYSGTFVVENYKQLPETTENCFTVVYVKCPKIACGIRPSGMLPAAPMVPIVNTAVQLQSKKRNAMQGPEDGPAVGIVGGRRSLPASWPFVVTILIDPGILCGGNIISDIWILSAAHCFVLYHDNMKVTVKAGLLRRTTSPPQMQVRYVKEIKFPNGVKYNLLKNDAALLLLNKPLIFNHWIRPICLPRGDYWKTEPKVGSPCVTAGWGTTSEKGQESENLREVEIPISPCSGQSNAKDYNICAGHSEGGKDSCYGDSGGPLYCKRESQNIYYLPGIVSHGDGCAEKNKPGVYSRTARFIGWIDSVIGSQNQFPSQTRPKKCFKMFCVEQGNICLDEKQICDGVKDCPKGSDESNCGLNGTSNIIDFIDNTTDVANLDVTTTEITIVDGNSTEQSDTTTLEVTTDFPSTTESFYFSNITNLPNSSSLFICQILTQSIPMSERCDKKLHCEDGTDETHCSCKDYLIKTQPHLICDHTVNCDDFSDEKDCAFCGENQFYCYKSRTCISENLVCDGEPDCKDGEDEDQCYALTNGKDVSVDVRKKPITNSEGIVAKRFQNEWKTACVSEERVMDVNTQVTWGKIICQHLGFRDVDKVKIRKIYNKKLDVKVVTQRNENEKFHRKYLKPTKNAENACDGFYISCKDRQQLKVKSLYSLNHNTGEKTWILPWEAAIYVGSQYRCSATILNKHWLLSTTHCLLNFDLRNNYTTAAMGISPGYPHVNGPNQQIVLIDNYKYVNHSGAVLFHLKNPINKTEHIKPIYSEKNIFPAHPNETCILTGEDSNYKRRVFSLQSDTKNCPFCQRCFTAIDKQPCDNSTVFGIIVCQGSYDWYPAAIVYKEDCCRFNYFKNLTPLELLNPFITAALIQNFTSVPEPLCDGIRCPQGQCVPKEKICDGVPHCPDKSDEHPKNCPSNTQNCSKSDLRCDNGRCIPKYHFCNGRFDCLDKSDETEHCTCADYLRLTQPQKICDNNRDCYDKSDEGPQCGCKAGSFVCSTAARSRICIPRDFVCDNSVDCPLGEDEMSCTKLYGTETPNEGELISMTHGVWHSVCFPSPVTQQKSQEICQSIGHSYGKLSTAVSSENSPPMIPQIDQFSAVRVGQNFFGFRSNKQLVTLAAGGEQCHRAFVKCSNDNDF